MCIYACELAVAAFLATRAHANFVQRVTVNLYSEHNMTADTTCTNLQLSHTPVDATCTYFKSGNLTPGDWNETGLDTMPNQSDCQIGRDALPNPHTQHISQPRMDNGFHRYAFQELQM